jgi:hypothetical protein
MRRLLLPLLLTAPLAAPIGAWAQMSAPPPRAATPGGPARAPAALPGLGARPATPVIPADPSVVLGPNEALFDAITRGDMAAARDAMARGADIGARNVLGQTPIEAAVDQGRNEIAFFLLASRGAGGGSGGSERLDGPPTAPPPARAGRTPRPTPPPRDTMASAPAPASSAPLAPRRWAGDGGTPRPEIGFLGFDAGRPAGGGPTEEPAAPARRRGRG